MNTIIQNVLLNEKIVHIYIQDNIIQYIADTNNTESLQNAPTYNTNECQIIDGTNKVALPTIANGHNHAAMSLFRGYGDDLPLMQWLQEKIWPVEAKLTEEDVYWGTKLACLEMIRTGTTYFNDMYWHFHGTAQAVEEMGLRAHISSVFIDIDDPKKAAEQQEQTIQLHEESKKYSRRIQFALGPHALYTVSKQSLEWIRDYSQKHNLLIHFHLAETKLDQTTTLEKYNQNPIHFLESIQFLSPRLIGCHGVQLNEEELDILKKYDVALVHNPCSNLKLAGVNFFPYKQIKEKNIRFCIGTDGCASNNNLNMLEETKFATLLQKWIQNDTTQFPAHEAWKTITQTAHEIFQIPAGIIQENKYADLMLLNLNDIHMTPHHDIISNLIYSVPTSAIDTVLCDGKILMQNKIIPQEQKIIQQIHTTAQKISQ